VIIREILVQTCKVLRTSTITIKEKYNIADLLKR